MCCHQLPLHYTYNTLIRTEHTGGAPFHLRRSFGKLFIGGACGHFVRSKQTEKYLPISKQTSMVIVLQDSQENIFSIEKVSAEQILFVGYFL